MLSQNSLSNTQSAQACKQKAMKCSEPVKLLCASMGNSVAVDCFSKKGLQGLHAFNPGCQLVSGSQADRGVAYSEAGLAQARTGPMPTPSRRQQGLVLRLQG